MTTRNIVDEPTITFKSISDHTAIRITDPTEKNTLVEIGGYDLQINFNMEHINSIEDVESAIDGLGQLFRQTIMDKLLEHKQTK